MQIVHTAWAVAQTWWPYAAILAGLIVLYRTLWPFNPNTWGKVALGVVLTLVVQHKVLCVMGFTEYLPDGLAKQNQDRYIACHGAALGIGRNQTSCDVLSALAKDGKGTEVAGLRQPPKLLTFLAASWQGSNGHRYQPNQPQTPPPYLLASTSKEGDSCDTGHVRVPSRYKRVVCDSARRHGIEPALLAAQIRQESGFNPHARSWAGAIGIGQFMPATAKRWGVNPYDPTSSINGTAKLISSYRRTYKRAGYSHDTATKYALAAYNAGPVAVKRHKGIPPYRETRNYVARIWQAFKRKV